MSELILSKLIDPAADRDTYRYAACSSDCADVAELSGRLGWVIQESSMMIGPGGGSECLVFAKTEKANTFPEILRAIQNSGVSGTIAPEPTL